MIKLLQSSLCAFKMNLATLWTNKFVKVERIALLVIHAIHLLQQTVIDTTVSNNIENID